MEATELTLKWEKFGLSRGLHDMLGAGELVDVTIACQGEYLQAHKTVLAACSLHFRQIFIMNPCQHPIVFMQDVQLPHLQALLSFMYTGEATIGQSELPALLRTAQALRVSGLATANQGLIQDRQQSSEQRGASEKTDIERTSGNQPTPSPPPPSKRPRRSSGWRDVMPPLQQAPSQPPPPPPRTNLPSQAASAQPPPLLHPADIKLEDDLSLEEAGEDDWPPDVAASAARPHFVLDEAHPEGVWFDAGPSTSGQSQPGTSQDGVAVSSRARQQPRVRELFGCDQCPRTFKKQKTLEDHKRNYHSPGGNVCHLCYKSYSTPGNLQTHQRFLHGIVRNETCCLKCGVDLRNLDALRVHMLTCRTDELMPCVCALCNRTFKHRKSLKEHVLVYHSEHACSYCHQSFHQATELLTHIAKCHRPRSDAPGEVQKC